MKLRLQLAALLLAAGAFLVPAAAASTYTINFTTPSAVAAGSAGASIYFNGTLPATFSASTYGICFYTGFGSTTPLIPTGSSAAGYTIVVPANTIQQVPSGSFTSGHFNASMYVTVTPSTCNGTADSTLTNTQTVTLNAPFLSGAPVTTLQQTNPNLTQPPPLRLDFQGTYFLSPMTVNYTWVGGSGNGTVTYVSGNSAVGTVPSTIPSTVASVSVSLCNHTTSFDYCSVPVTMPVAALKVSNGTLTATPNPSTPSQNVTMTAKFTGSGTFTGAPTGTVTFTASGNFIGTGKLVLDPTAAIFQTGTQVGVSGTASLAKLMDLNNDGLNDVVFFDSTARVHIIMAVMPYGGFGSESIYTPDSNCSYPNSFVTGDVNGDGFPDIVFSCTNNVSGAVITDVLLGNGDGSFAAPIALSGIFSAQLALADVDHDSKLDLIVGGQLNACLSAGCIYGFQVFKGNGSGGFTSLATLTTSAIPGTQLLVMDVNNDSYPDLVELNASQTGPSTIDIYSGIASGTSFGTLSGSNYIPNYQIAVGNVPNFYYNMVTGDFNGDGLPDFALLNSGNGVVTALNTSTSGVVSFGAAKTITASGASGLAIADFTGDGYADLAIAATSGVTIYDSDGAGNFGTHYSNLTLPGSAPFLLLAGDVNADKEADLVLGVASTFDSVATYVTTGPANATFKNAFAAGTFPLAANWPGNFLFAGSSGNTSLVVSLPSTTTSLITSGTPTEYGQSITFTATVSTAAGSPTGTVSFLSDGSPIGSGTVSGGVATFTTTTLVAASHSITAIYSGDANFAGSTSATVTQVVSSAPVTVSWVPSPATITYGTALAAGQLNATASSKYVSSVPGTFSYTPTLGTVPSAGNPVTLSVTFTPTSTINFQTSSGTANIIVTKATPTITWPPPAPVVAGTALSATQLNASATGIAGAPNPLPGTYVYNPASGSIPAAGNQTLNVTFTPADATDYTTAPGSVTLTVIALNIGSITPNTGLLGDPAKTITLTGTGFLASSVVQVNGTSISTTYGSATSLTATIPASYFQTVQTLNITVVNTSPAAISNTSTLSVTAPAPTVTFTGPTTSAPGTQPSLSFSLSSYPVALTGTVTIGFTSPTGVVDPNIVFAGSGSTTQTFNVPALSTTVPTIQLQAGTVTGTITVTLTLTAGTTTVNTQTVTITIPPAVPTATSIVLTRSGTTLTVVLHGFSNTRTLASATFHFNAAAGSSINDPDITIPATTLFGTYYAGASSIPDGSAFIYTQPFTLDKDASTVGSVTVTLTNSVGASTTVTAQ